MQIKMCKQIQILKCTPLKRSGFLCLLYLVQKTTFAKKIGNAVHILHTLTFISSPIEINVKILFRAE